MSRVIAHPIVKYTAFSPIVHTRCLSELGVVSLEPLGLTAPTWLSGEFRDLVGDTTHPWSSSHPHPISSMSSKRQKMTAKRGRANEEPPHSYDHDKFVNESATERFGFIYKNRSFIKENGLHHPEDFFRKTIANKGWRALCQPPTPAATMVVREFYTNLASHMNKKVRVRGV